MGVPAVYLSDLENMVHRLCAGCVFSPHCAAAVLHRKRASYLAESSRSSSPAVDGHGANGIAGKWYDPEQFVSCRDTQVRDLKNK
jgi:hypothetical protein